MESSVKTLAIKVYDEQMPHGLQAVLNSIQSADTKVYQIIYIKHDRDYSGDDFFAPSIEKPHYHILVRIVDKSPRKIRTILNLLHIAFRPVLDDVLREKHGLETVENFTNYTVYLLHKTEKAISDGKSPYEIDEFISNLSLDEVQQIMDGYTRVSSEKRKVTLNDLIELDKTAFGLGYQLKDFLSWYGTLPFIVRSHTKMKTIEESYHRGVAVRIAENNEVNRLCIFIRGLHNVGKTYAAQHVLKTKRTITVEGGGSGKFDKLTPSTEAIIISDDVAPNLLNMTDNFMCQAYRRNSNNPFWCGQYFVVTSNLLFTEWLAQCGIKEAHFQAMQSRFYICHIEKNNGKNILLCDSVSNRGSAEEQRERQNRFIEFSNQYNQIISNYVPEQIQVDYSSLLFWQELKEIAEIEYKKYCRWIDEETLFANQAFYEEIQTEQHRLSELQKQTAVSTTTKSVSSCNEILNEQAEILRLNGYDLKALTTMPGLLYVPKKKG